MTDPVATQPAREPRRYEVRHRTEYHYESAVTASYGWAYLTPRELPGQRCLSSVVEVQPGASITVGDVDFFGNHGTYFEVHEPHEQLVVSAISAVEIDRVSTVLADLDAITWEAARDATNALPPADRADAVGFRLASPQLPDDGEVAQFAASILTPGRPLGDALAGLTHAIFSGFEYESGSTKVTTTLTEVLATRQGVCQDFAHLAVACLRWAGLPARYVSGYLETQPPPGQVKLQGADASHAWASVLVPDLGWVDLDPTNDKVADSSYVVTAWGRDYTDVPPLKGVIFTESATSTMRVAVDVIRG
jgi:transglutaminase-like putative cysteine protease